MLIGLCGYKNSGKDTVGAYLVKEHGFERRAFADKIKESVSALFDIEPWKLEEMKNDPKMLVTISYWRDNGVWQPSPYEDMTVRQMLQRYGTEAHREVFGEDFWLDQVLPLEGFYSGRALVITDCRFVNELERISDIGGHIVYVQRDILGQADDPHPSEQEGILVAQRYGYQLDNTGSVEHLFDNIERMLASL